MGCNPKRKTKHGRREDSKCCFQHLVKVSEIYYFSNRKLRQASRVSGELFLPFTLKFPLFSFIPSLLANYFFKIILVTDGLSMDSLPGSVIVLWGRNVARCMAGKPFLADGLIIVFTSKQPEQLLPGEIIQVSLFFSLTRNDTLYKMETSQLTAHKASLDGVDTSCTR